MTTLGVIIGTRGFFPAHLCEDGRKLILEVLKEEGFDAVVLPEDATSYGYGAVESYEDAKKCAALFKANRDKIDGILVTLPNFGDERAVAGSIRLAELNVPVLVHAYPDELGKMDIDHRRDSFCGKMSLCNNLTQYGIPFTLTRLHTIDPRAESFRADLQKFGATCRVVRGLKHVRYGAIGARPANFNTVRFSEKLLEEAGLSIEPIDLYEVFGRVGRMKDEDSDVQNKLAEVKNYLKTGATAEQALLKMAKFGLVIDQLCEERELAGTAIQCWTAMEEFFGVVPCTIMSMLSNGLKPSACETDITGLVGMHAMNLASGRPSALLDWNNNYGNDPNQAVVFHCSNLPQDFYGGEGVMDYQAIIAGTVGKENTQGTVVGQIKPGPVTYCRVSTDDSFGAIRVYLGEGEITDQALDTFGGYGVIKIPNFQDLLHYICANGYEHHVALNQSLVAEALREAFDQYLGWEVYHHQ